MATMPPPGPPPPPEGPPPAPYPAAPPGYPQQYPQYPPYPQQYGYAPAAPVPFRRTVFLPFAQIIVIIEGILAILGGAGLIYLGLAGTSVLDSAGISTDFSTTATGVFIGVGVVVALIGLLWLILGVRVGHPSQGARWTIVILEILAILGTVSGLLQRNTTPLGSIIALALEAIVIYALAFDPATRHAFSGR